MTKIQKVHLDNVFQENYYEYGMYTIQDRAVADIRDGLKPVHRKIIYEMLASKIKANSKHVKVARITGQVMGKYHPHGDKAIEDALVNLSLDWKNPLPIIDIKGNNGSVFGDTHAAGRYIEARLTPMGELYGENINPGVVPFVPNYDDTEKLPSILPAQIPYLLINGSDGIAVGLASSIPTHNPKEVVEAFIAYAKKPKIKTSELMKILPGPDFPTKGRIINKDSLLDIYETGTGSIRVQGKIRYNKKDHALHIYELPFTASGSMNNLVAELTNGTVEKINEKTKKKVPPKLTLITDVADNCGKDGIDIKLTLKKDADPNEAIREVLAKTKLETTLKFEFLALNNRKIKKYTLKSYFKEYLEFQDEIVSNEFKMKLQQLEKQMNIVHGLLLLREVVDEVIASAKVSSSKDELVEVLMTGKVLDVPKRYHKVIKTFRFNEVQAKHIAGIAIYKLSKFDQQALIKEGQTLHKEIEHARSIVEDDKKRHKLIIKRHENIVKALPHERHTEIVQENDTQAPVIEQKVSDIYVSMDKYQYVRIEEKHYEGAINLKTSDRVGFFDSEGILWNLHLDNQKPTKGRGVLSSTLVAANDIVGFSSTISGSTERLGLFVFTSGHVRVTDMRKYMTKQKATKVASGKTKETLLAYYDIPENAKSVIINGEKYQIKDLSIQGVSGSGRKTIKPTQAVDIEFE